MRTEVIKADSIEAAVERILDELNEDTASTARSISSRNNVVYFDGWDGLGASAVLRGVAQRLDVASPEAVPAGLQFDQIIHVDCSKWESRRGLQRAIAEQLKLPAASVMDMLDRQDEEDDFHGIAEGSRTEIPQVVRKMYEHIQKLNQKFLVIFHNGSDEEVDMATFCGFPLSGYSTNKVLWTFQGAFRLKPRMKVDDAVKNTGSTDVFLSASAQSQDPQELWNYLVHQDAAEVASRITTRAASETSTPQTVSTDYVANYFLYMWKLCGMVHHLRMDYDMATHGSNYWICDGIKQLQQGQADIGKECDDDGPWRAALAVQHDVRLDSDYYHHNSQSLPPHLIRCADSTATMPYWTSPTHGVLFFSTGDTLQHFSKLGVLKLSRCTFSFSSPPFLCCSSLRFLWLDHCQDQAITSKHGAADRDEGIQRCCFQRLWVLDLRYTCCDQILSASMLDVMTHLTELNVEGAQDWDIGQLQGRLPNIRKLRVTKSTVGYSSGHSEDALLFSRMNKMELLEFSGNRTMQPGGEVAKLHGIMSTCNNCLETVRIIDGCAGIHKFSFRGCAKLKNLLLGGLFDDLRMLDLSGTAVKTLDLSAMTARSLDELVLDNCDKLCAILWPPLAEKGEMGLAKLHIDTTQSAAAYSRSVEEKMKDGRTAATRSPSWPMVLVHGAQAPSAFDWYISTEDARLLRSFEPSCRKYFENHDVHIEISSPTSSCPVVAVGGSKKEGIRNGIGEEPQVLPDTTRRRRRRPPPPPQYNSNNNELMYADVAAIIVEGQLLEAGEGNGRDDDAPTITRAWPCPSPIRLGSSDCYLYIQDQQMTAKTKAGMDGGAVAIATTLPSTICDGASMLHVHDSLYNKSIPGAAAWHNLLWCRVERCPRLDFIFTAPHPQLLGGGRSSVCMCWCLRTFWASQLPRARFMWDTSKLPLTQIQGRSFEELTFLHLDFCPRLIQVLPFSSSVIGARRYLETIEILWCGDLREVFPSLLDSTGTTESSHQETVEFPNLKRIHLHELPMLESICGRGRRMHARVLETIRIRGCWNLRHLPAVDSNRSSGKVECDCEKEWWERLEWDGLDGKRDYKPIHPRYYKKKMLRGSVLV